MRTLGVEEEYGLVDPQTRELVALAKPVLARAEQTLGERVEHEFKASQVEIATPVCETLADVERELRAARSRLGAAARAEGARLFAGGSHPFSLAAAQPITDKPRYRGLSDVYRELAREIVIFGCHVHVGVDDPESAIALADRARPNLAPLIALTANSPFWEGHETGYASYRTEVWARWPLSGPPPAFGSRAAYDRLIGDLMQSESIDDETKIYWDLRPSARFPTLEFRVTDVCTSLALAMTVAALARATVETCERERVAGLPPPEVDSQRIKIAHWCAARNGLADDLIDLRANRRRLAREVIDDYLAWLRPALDDAGDGEHVRATVADILATGTGAERQRAHFVTGGFDAVVDGLIVAE